MGNKLPTVLVTGSGNMTGVNLIRALRMNDEHIDVIGCDVSLVESNVSNILGVKNYQVPRAADNAYMHAIAKIVKAHNVRAVIASNDHEVRALANNIKMLADLGVTFNGYTPEVLTFLNKERTTRLLEKHGIKTPKLLPNTCMPYPWPGPYVIRKNCVGSEQKFTHIIRVPSDVDSVPPRVWKSDSVITEYVQGREYTIDVLCDHGKMLSAAIRWRRSVIYGTVHFGEIVKDDDVMQKVCKVARVSQLDGINCVQCIITDDKECYFTEINPRPGTGIDLTVNAGVNMPVIWLERLSGLTPGIPSATIGMKMTRFYSGHYFK